MLDFFLSETLLLRTGNESFPFSDLKLLIQRVSEKTDPEEKKLPNVCKKSEIVHKNIFKIVQIVASFEVAVSGSV